MKTPSYRIDTASAFGLALALAIALAPVSPVAAQDSASPAAAGAADEPMGAPESGDFSGLGWTEAFLRMHAQVSRQYAFAAWKDIQWERMLDRYAPRVGAAEAAGDADAYRIAMQEYIKELPDGHVKIATDTGALKARFIGGSFGLGLALTDDGSCIAAAVSPSGAAAGAGIAPGSRIVRWNGMDVRDAMVAADTRWFRNAATRETLGLQRLQALTRGPVGSRATVEFLPPDAAGGSGAATTAAAGLRSATLVAAGDGYADLGLFDLAPWLPLEQLGRLVDHRMLGGDIGYIRVYIESDLADLTKYPRAIPEKFAAALRELAGAGARDLVLDLRGNRGGSDQVAADLASHFHSERTFYERLEVYDSATGRFRRMYSDIFAGTLEPSDRPIDLEPREPYFGGRIAVLVNPATISSGEGLAMAVGRLPRAEVMGFNGSHGSFGALGWPVAMPCGIAFEYSLGRSVDETGVIQLDSGPDGSGGVRPEARVPLTADAALAFARGEDVELRYAIDRLVAGSDPGDVASTQK